MKTNYCRFLSVTLSLWTAFAFQAGATTVTATLDPKQISLGESAQLTVTVSGGQEQSEKPVVDGLEITPVGTSTQIQIVNGTVTSNASCTYAVTPQREGTFTIPAIRAGNAVSQPVTLTVGRGSPSPAAQAQVQSPPSTGPVVIPPQATAPAPASPPTASDRFGTIEITIPKKEFYEGELVPVDIHVYVPDEIQASVGDLPKFTGDGFTLNSLSTKLDQSQQVVNGRGYNVLTWHSALTAVKTGDYPISLKMPLTVVVPQQMPQAQDADQMFNNFFRNAFNSFGVRKEITLATKPQTLKVLPLPQAGKPAGFSGAVGQFDVEASANPTQVNAGDPITLQVKITGTGNFERVDTGLLAASPQWKTYSSKSHFEGADSIGYQGVKTFEQPVIPSDSSVTSIPSLTFSYFNPETRQYVTRSTQPIAVTVIGGAPSPVASAAPAPSAAPTPTPPPAPASDLRPNQIEPGAFFATLRPVYLNPAFMAGQGLPLLALLSGLFFIRSRRKAADPTRAQATVVQRAIRQQVEAMDAAMKDGQADAFFVHARTALQQAYGQRWNLRPEAITLADVESRLGEGSAHVRTVFEMADQASYSDLHFEAADLQQWRQVVITELAEKNS